MEKNALLKIRKSIFYARELLYDCLNNLDIFVKRLLLTCLDYGKTSTGKVFPQKRLLVI